MVGGTIRPKLIHRESFRAAVLHLSEIRAVLESIAAKKSLLTTPSLLSSGTQVSWRFTVRHPPNVRTLRIAPRYAFGGHFRGGLPLERADRWSFETGIKERGRPRAGPFPDYDAGGLYVSG